MKYLVDSDVVADWLQGKGQAVNLLTSLQSDGPAISLVTYGEVYEGILFSKDPKQAASVFRRFYRNVTMLPLNRVILRRFARLRGELRVSGTLLPDFDLLIAATAIHFDLTLVTRNTRHFQRIPDLTLYQDQSS